MYYYTTFLNCSFFVHEVNWNNSVQFMASFNALEVNVHDFWLERVTLHSFNDCFNVFFAHFDSQNVRVKRFEALSF